MNQPYVPTPDEIYILRPLPFPFFLDLDTARWERIDKTWFVDHSGWGCVGEPALTQDEFLEQLLAYVQEHPTHGYAVTDVGLFQLFIGVYRPMDADDPTIVFSDDPSADDLI